MEEMSFALQIGVNHFDYSLFLILHKGSSALLVAVFYSSAKSTSGIPFYILNSYIFFCIVIIPQSGILDIHKKLILNIQMQVIGKNINAFNNLKNS
jgi:hypothetical protein